MIEPRRGTENGFTLLEILLATAITAVIMTTVGTAFLGILQAREEVRALSDSTSSGPRVLALIERDLRALWHHNIRENRVFLGRNQDISGFPADRIDMVATTDSVGLVDDGTGTPKRSTICEVGYWLKENQRYSDLRELWRREDPMVDEDLSTGGTFQMVHDRVKSLEITYFETLGSKAEPFYEWDSSRNNQLPRRIKIELTVERILPNRNRVTGLEAVDFEETTKKYVRHMVFDQRYPEILKAGIAMVPLLPQGPPEGSADGGGGGGGGGGGSGGPEVTIATGQGMGPGALPEGKRINRSAGGNTTQVSGPGSSSGGPSMPPPKGFNIEEMLRGGGTGGGLGGFFGSGSGR